MSDDKPKEWTVEIVERPEKGTWDGEIKHHGETFTYVRSLTELGVIEKARAIVRAERNKKEIEL